jgi:hypothetical protein
MNTITTYVAKAVRIAMTLIIVLGMLHILQSIIPEIVRTLFPPVRVTQNTPTRSASRQWQSVQFLQDGTPHYMHYTQSANTDSSKEQVEIYDTKDIFLYKGLSSDRPKYPYLSYAKATYNFPRLQPIRNRYMANVDFSCTLDIPVIKEQLVQEIWRYDRHKQIFAGYDQSGHALGFLGRIGLTDHPLGAQALGRPQGLRSWCPSERDTPFLLWLTQHRLYEIDAQARHVTCRMDAKEEVISQVSILGWDETNDYWVKKEVFDPNIYRPLIICQSSDTRYHLYLRHPDQNVTVSLPEAWSQQLGNHYRFTATHQNLFLTRSWTDYPAPPQAPANKDESRQWHEGYRNTEKKHCKTLYRINDQGALEEIHTAQWTQPPRSSAQVRTINVTWNTQRVVLCLSPALYHWIHNIAGPYQIRPWYEKRDQHVGDIIAEITFRMCPFHNLDYLIPSLMMVLLAFWHGRSRLTSRVTLLFWLLCILLFNLAGFLAYLAFNHIPVIRCNSCGKTRGLQHDACPRCNALLPEPIHTKPHLIMNESMA